MTLRRMPSLVSLTVAFTATFLLTGCPPTPPPPPPTPPVAEAGPNQTVTAGDEVVLDGSGSSGVRGGTLSFSWRQVSGTPVTLSEPENVITTFVAPAAPGALVFELTVTEQGGGRARDSVRVTVEPGPPPPPSAILYVANFFGDSVTAYRFEDPAELDGNLVPDAQVLGFQTQLSAPSAVVIDNGGALLVYNSATPAISGYADALDLEDIDGNTAPNRLVQGGATGLVGVAAMAYDPFDDLLFVTAADVGAINVFANASTSFFNGNVPPAGVIVSPDVGEARGINFATVDELYVANGLGLDNVTVFADASTLDGNVFATRIIRSVVFTDVADAFLDVNNTLFVVNGVEGRNRIDIFANAALLDGMVFPDATLTVVGAVDITAIIVDSTGNGYIADAGGDAIYGYSNIVARSGPLPPDRILRGPATGLAGPVRMFLLE